MSPYNSRLMAPPPISIKLRCTSWKQLAALHERDLTRNAVFLKSSAPPPMGTPVRINLTLPTQVLIIMRGVVQEHVGPGGLNGRGPGVDIELRQVPEDAMATIEAALASARREGAIAPSAGTDAATQTREPPQPDAPSSPPETAAGEATSADEADTASREEEAPPASPPSSDYPVAKLEQELESLRKLNPFQILGVGYETTDEAVNRAFASLSKRYHPDRFADGEDEEAREIATAIFSLIRHAYRTLNSADARTHALQELEDKRVHANGSAPAPAEEEDAGEIPDELGTARDQDAGAEPPSTPDDLLGDLAAHLAGDQLGAPEEDEAVSPFTPSPMDEDAAEAAFASEPAPEPLPQEEAPALGGDLAGFDEDQTGYAPDDDGGPIDIEVDDPDAPAPQDDGLGLGLAPEGHTEAESGYPSVDDGGPIEVEEPEAPPPQEEEIDPFQALADETAAESASVPEAAPEPVSQHIDDAAPVELAIDDPTPIPPPSPIGEGDDEREDAPAEPISNDIPLDDITPLDDDTSIELLDDDALAVEPEDEAAAAPRPGPPPPPIPGARPAPPPIPGARKPQPAPVPAEPDLQEAQPAVAAVQEAAPSIPLTEDDAAEEPPASAAEPVEEAAAAEPVEEAADQAIDEAPPAPVESGPPLLGMAAEPRFAEAVDLIDAGNYKEALTVYKVVLRRDPRDKAARVGIELIEGLKALAERDRLEAAQRFEYVLELDPDNQRAVQALAEMRRQAAMERQEHLEKLRNQQD